MAAHFLARYVDSRDGKPRRSTASSLPLQDNVKPALDHLGHRANSPTGDRATLLNATFEVINHAKAAKVVVLGRGRPPGRCPAGTCGAHNGLAKGGRPKLRSPHTYNSTFGDRKICHSAYAASAYAGR
jgi:hypothetical protein